MNPYWPWWLGGTALATVALGYWWLQGRLLGVSGTFANVLKRDPGDDLAGADAAALEAALLEATRAEFGDSAIASSQPAPGASISARPRARLAWSAHLTLLVAITIGGTLGALSRGAFGVRVDLGPEHLRLLGGGWRSWAALIAGGLLVGFGTAMAGGCTSGHGLCGTSRLQLGSLLATAAFFGAAVAVSLLLMRMAS